MGIIRAKKPIIDADIPSEIARDTETTAAINAHVAATDPHPIYLTQTKGDGRYRQSAVALADGDIPAAIARDAEVTAAVAAHVTVSDPHPSLWNRITAAFLSLAGGQQILKNNPAIQNGSFLAPSNHLELTTNNGSNPILGFHKAGVSATALYHAGYGSESLRIRNADGYDSELLHRMNHVDAPGLHSVRCTLFSTVVAAVGSETIVSFSPIPFGKIVGVDCQMIENMGSQGMRFIPKGGGGDFAPGAPVLVSGFVKVSAVSASQLVGIPLHILIWHIP